MISVACDICGQTYDFPDERYGKLQKCKECDTRFEVCDENAPVEPELEGEEPSESDFLGVWRILRGTAAGVAILIACGWMMALLFYDPWQRPPLEFKGRGNPNSSRPVAAAGFNNNPAVTRPATNPPAFPATPPANPQFASGAPPQTTTPPPVQSTPPAAAPPAVATTPSAPLTGQELLEQQRAEIQRIREEAKARVRSQIPTSPPTAAPSLPGPTIPGQPPNAPPNLPPGPSRPRFGPGNLPGPGPRPPGNRPGMPGRP